MRQYWMTVNRRRCRLHSISLELRDCRSIEAWKIWIDRWLKFWFFSVSSSIKTVLALGMKLHLTNERVIQSGKQTVDVSKVEGDLMLFHILYSHVAVHNAAIVSWNVILRTESCHLHLNWTLLLKPQTAWHFQWKFSDQSKLLDSVTVYIIISYYLLNDSHYCDLALWVHVSVFNSYKLQGLLLAAKLLVSRLQFPH